MLTTHLYGCISSMTCSAMEVASITLEAEVTIWNPQCAITASARLEHFLHCKYCCLFSGHEKLVSRVNCFFSFFLALILTTIFYCNYFPYQQSTVTVKTFFQNWFLLCKIAETVKCSIIFNNTEFFLFIYYFFFLGKYATIFTKIQICKFSNLTEWIWNVAVLHAAWRWDLFVFPC